MAEKKSWRDYTSGGTEAEEDKSDKKTSSWRDYVNPTTVVGKNVTEQLNNWLTNHNSYISDYQNRYSGRKYSYEDAYVSDSSDWLNSATERRNALDNEANSILSYLDQYGGHLDSKLVNQIRQTITGARGTQAKILEAATKDNEWWNSFNNEELVNAFGSAEDAYKYYQRADGYSKKYTGQKYDDIQKALETFETNRSSEIAELESALSQYKELSRWEQDEKGKTALENLSKKYGSIEDLENTIKTKKLASISEEEQWLISNQDELYKNDSTYTSKATSGYKSYEAQKIAEQEAKAQEEANKTWWDKAADFVIDTFGQTTDNPTLDLMMDQRELYVEDTSWREPNDEWSTEQKNRFGYLWTEDREKAYAYAEQVNNQINAKKKYDQQQGIGNWASKDVSNNIFNPLGTSGKLGTLGAVASAPFAMGDFMDDLIEYSARGTITQKNTLSPFEMGQAAQSGIANKLNAVDKNGVAHSVLPEEIPIIGGKGWGDIYSLGVSTANSMLSALTLGGAGTLVNFIGQGGAAGVDDALSRGATPEQALLYGTIVGAAEGLTEFIPAENLIKVGSSATVKNYLKQVLKQGVGEFVEEGSSSIIGNVADYFVMQDKSNFNTLVKEYMDSGMSEEDAKSKAIGKLFGDAVYDAIGGFASGSVSAGLTGGYRTMVDASKHNQQNIDAIKQYGEHTDALIQEGLQSDKNSESYQLAEKYQKKTDGGKALSGFQIRNLVKANDAQFVVEDYNEALPKAKERLKALGETKNVDKIADLVAKRVSRQELTRSEKSTLARSQFGAQVAKEMTTPTVETQNGTKIYNATYKSLEDRVGTEGRFGVSENGQATIRETNEEIDIGTLDVATVGDGQMTFKVADDREVYAGDIDFADEDQSFLVSAVSDIENITPAAATAIMHDVVDTSKPLGAQLNGIDEAYTYGYNGYSVGDMKTGDFTSNLTDVQMMSAYRLGQSARSISDTDADAPIVKMRTVADAKLTAEQKTAKQKARIESDDVEVYFKDGGTVVKFDEHTGKYDDKRMAAVNTAKFLSKLGIGGKYYFFESYKNADGVRVYKDANGNEVEAPNGMYKDADGSIHIDLNAGDRGQGTALFTLGHELTHFVKAQSKKQFKILGDLVTEAFDKTDTSMHDRVVAKQDFLSKIRGHHVTYNEAFEEVVADAMSTMITDGSFHEKIMEIKVKDKGLFNTIKRFFDKMIAKFREVYAELTPDQKDARDIREMKDMFDKIQTAFAEALVEASDNFHAAMESVVEAKAEPMSAEEIVTEGAVVTDGEGVRHSIRSMKHDIAEGKMFEDLKTVCGWTQAQVDTLKTQLEALVEYMIPYRNILDMNEAYGAEGRRFSPYKPNSDPLYKISMDFSTLCSKRLLTQYVIEQLQLRENRPMSAEEQMAIRDMLNEYRKVEKGLQVACAMCYVEAARLKSPKQVQRWLDDPAPLLKDYFGKKNKEFNDSVKKAQADFKESKGYDREAPKKDMKPADVKELNKIGPKMRSQYQMSAEEQAIVERAKSLPNSTYLTAGNLANLSETDPVIYDAYTAFVRTATRSKSLEKDEPYYYGDSTRDNGNGIVVTDSFIEAVNKENGMRFSSWSDWRIQHLLDYITAVIDNSVRGAAMHGYTKFGDEVRVLGKTGMMFNMSGVAGTQTGLNEDGSLSFSPTESIDVNEAIQLREEFPEHAGLQCIGVSDEHIVALLRSDIIDYVIPYHVSGLNAVLRRMVNIYGWADYTGTQHASIDKSIKLENAVDKEHWHEEPVFSEFFVGYDTGMTGIEAMKASAEKYKQMCKDRGLTPKFNQFATEDNYWKLLIDRKMINQQTGNLIRQKAVTPTFDFNVIKGVVDKFVENYDAGLEKRALNHIVENWDSIPQRIKDLKKQGGTKAKQTKKAAATLANQTVAAQPSDGIKRSDRIVDQMKRSMDSIMAMESVASINKGNAVPFLGSRNENYTAGGKVFKAQGGLAVREGYGTVQLTVNGAKESVFHGNGPAKQATFPAIKAVIEQGIEVGRDYNHNGKGFDTVTFAAPIDFFGHKESLGVVVKEFNNAVGEKNFYIHEICDENGNYIQLDDGIVTVKEKVAPAGPNPKSAAGATYVGNSPTITVAHPDGSVKKNSGKNSDRDSTGAQLTKEQQEFFKDSKVRDKKGNLLVVYHGTTANFNTFKKGDVGFHFGTKGAARGRAGYGKNVTIKEVYLNITNPVVFDEDLGSWDADYRLTRELYDRGILTHDESMSVLRTDDGRYKRSTESANKKLASVLMAKGYDGIAYQNTFETKKATTSYIAFASNQAKEITNVNPTSNPDIRYSERGDGASNRHLLANAFEGISQNSVEYKMIQDYKAHIKELNELESKLSDLNAEIRKMRFGTDVERDAKKLKGLEDEAKEVAKEINRYDKRLLSLEASEPLRKVIERERLKEREMSSKKLREVKERYRLQKEVKESELLRDIRETKAALKNQKNETSIMEKEFIRIAKAYEKLDAKSTAKSDKDTKAIADLKAALKEEAKKHRDDQKTWEAEFNRLMREYELADRSIDRLEEKIERQKQAAKNKVESRQKTELRHKIRKTIRDLDKLLNRGNKKTNVKEDMKSFASKALELADYLFTDHISNDDLIRKGITVRMTEKEAALVKETEDILSKLYDHADSLTDEEFTRLDAKRKANEDKLRDLLKAQRNERLNTPVYNLFNDLVTEYASLKNSKQDSVKAAYDEVLENSLRAFMGDEDRVKILKNMRVADMTTEELNWLYRAYTMVLTNVRNANKFHVKGMTATIEQMVGRIAGDFSSRKIPDKKLAIAVQKLANKIGWDYEKLYYALDRIGSEAFTELIMNIADSENTVMQDVMEAIAYRDEIVKNYGFNNWAVNKEIDREFMDNSGKKFKMTLGQLMSLYAYSRREGAWDHIEYGGFVFGDAALTNPRPADSYKLSKEQCEAITSLLTKEQKGYVEDMQKFLSETMGEKGNEVSMQLYGIKMFGEKNYFPIHVAGQFKAQAQESQAKAAAGFSSMSNAGFTHAQNPNAKAPFVLEGFNEIWTDHVNEMSRYHGTVPALEDLRRVMNRSTYSDSVAESQSIKQLMENSYGKEAVEYFDNLYREANSGAITDKLQKNSKKLLSLFRKNSVAYSLSVLIQQPASLVRAYSMIDKKYFGFKGVGAITSGVAKAVSSKWNPAYANAYNEMLKYAPGVTMAKEIGGFDTATGGSIRSYLLDTGKSLKQKWNTGTALEKGKTVLDVVDDNAIANLPNVADKIAWIEIWNACKREAVARNKNMKPGSEEFMQAVGERFTDVIRATQVYDSIFAKSPMLKSKNLAVQYLVSFMNEPNTVANMAESAVRSATRGDWKQGVRTAAVVIHSIIFTNVLKSIVYALRDDDEDETYIEKYIEAVAGGLMDDFNALNYIPIARDVVSLAQGYDVERADMAIVADAVDALSNVFKNAAKNTEDMTEEELAEFDKKVTEANWKLVESVAAFFGIPVKNVRREIMGVIDHARIASANAGQATAQSVWDTISEAVIGSIPFMQSKNTKQDKLYEAIIAGDKDYLARLKSTYKDDSAYQSAVRKALRENDSRIHEAAQAKYEGRTEEYKRIFREIQKEGKFSFDDIMSAVNSEESAIRNKLEPDKATSSYTASDFVESIVLGDSKSAEAMKEDIIATKVANGKTQAEAEKEFISSVATGIRDAYSSGLLDEAGAEKMLMEYADKDEEEAASKVGYWGFCEDNPKYDYFTESNVKDYREFAEPENISLEVYAQFINGTKGLADIKDKWGDVEVTKREQVLEVIDSLPLTWQQKDALYLAAGYSESKIWDVPW